MFDTIPLNVEGRVWEEDADVAEVGDEGKGLGPVVRKGRRET